MLKNLYSYYHKKHYGYKKLYRGYQRKHLICNVVAGKAAITSAVAGGITLSPIVCTSLSAFGVIVQIVDKKIERANFARAEYTKIRDAIRFYLKGEPFNEKEFLDKLKMIDDFVSDHCVEIPSKMGKKIQPTFDHVIIYE